MPVRSLRSTGVARPSGWFLRATTLLLAALLAAAPGHAQPAPGGGQVVVPGSSTAGPGDTGVRAHTNTLIFVPNRGPAATAPNSSGAAGSPSRKVRNTGKETGSGSKPE